MSATVTSGLERWLDDRSRDDSASAANAATDIDAARDEVARDADASTDADAPIAPNDAPESNADPNAAKRFLAYAPFAK